MVSHGQLLHCLWIANKKGPFFLFLFWWGEGYFSPIYKALASAYFKILNFEKYFNR